MHRYIPILSLLAVLFPCAAAAQDSARIVIISPRVGTTIDRAERDMYGLFRSLPDFQAATFFSHSGRYYGLVALRAGESARDTLIEYREHALAQMAERIDNHDLLSAGRYTMGSNPAILLQGESVSLAALGVDRARLSALPPLVLVPTPATDLPSVAPGTDLPAAAPATIHSSQTARVYLRSGSVLKGRVLSFDSSAVKIDAEGLGVLTLPIAEVLRVSLNDDPENENASPTQDETAAVFPASDGSQYRFSDPSSFRGFLLPTAYTVPRGEWFFADDMILVGTVGGGISSSVMLSGGTLLTFLDMFDESGPLFHFNVKAQLFGSSKAALSLGAAGLFAPGDESSVPLLPYVVITTGNYDANLSMIAGMTTILGDDGDTGTLLGFSGQTRVGPGVKLLFDAAYIPGVDVVPGLIGLRFFGRRMSGDIGFLFAVGEGNVEFGLGIPFANFTIFF